MIKEHYQKQKKPYLQYHHTKYNVMELKCSNEINNKKAANSRNGQ